MMPKARVNNTSSSSSATLTITSNILHLNRHQRSGSTSSGGSSSSSPTSRCAHNASYGLLEPAQNKKPTIRHRRKSSSSNSSWSDRGFDFTDLKDKSVDLGGRIADTLPGVRYSAAFISTLRTNLALSAQLAPPSPNLNALTPSIMPRSSFTGCTFLPLATSEMTTIGKEQNPLSDVPELTFDAPQDAEEKTAGLRLVADTYSQQRSTVSKLLIYNPITALLLAISLGGIYPFIYRDPARDKPALLLTVVGMVMFILAGIRHLVRGYQDLADTVNWEWLGNDGLAVAKFGNVVIASCVYRFESSSSSKKHSPCRRMLIRAWTTRPRERGRGIGRGLLENVVEIAKEKGCLGVEFAPDEIRAGSRRLLSGVDGFLGLIHINRGFEQNEIKARAMLEHVLEERWDKKRRGSR